MARRGCPVHEREEYMDLLEKYLEKLPLSVQRGKRPGDENRFLLDGIQREKLPCGEAKLLVHGGGYMQFEYSVEIPRLEEQREMLLSAINGRNSSGSGGLSFYLLDEKTSWSFAAEAKLQMDSCNAASARREAMEVYERMLHVCYVLGKFRQHLPEFFGEEALEKLAQERQAEESVDIGAFFEPADVEEFDFIEPDLDEDAFVWNEETGTYDYTGELPKSSDIVEVTDEDVDGLLERFERDGAESLSGSELIRLHIGLACRLEEKQAEFARLQQAVQASRAEEEPVMPEWHETWDDEAEMLREAAEEGTCGWDNFELFCLRVAQRREEARRARGLPLLYQPSESAETEEAGERPVRNIPLKPKKW